MFIAILLRLLSKKELHVRPGKKLHAHGRNLCRIHGSKMVFRYLPLPTQPHLEGMTCFVGQYINIAGCAVRVGENIGSLIKCQVIAVTSGRFAGAA